MKSVPSVACGRLARRTETGNAHARFRAALRRLVRLTRGRTLELRTLHDHLKRDIGLLDGNDPRGPRP